MTTNNDAFEEQTCGKGLEANSVFPAKLAELTAGLANVLEHHTTALDRSDSKGKNDYDAYESLIVQFRDISAWLAKAANEMKTYRDLPMANHDMSMMSSPGSAEVFEKFVQMKRELLELLESSIEEDERMLTQMRA
jgi:hypothetical protein